MRLAKCRPPVFRDHISRLAGHPVSFRSKDQYPFGGGAPSLNNCDRQRERGRSMNDFYRRETGDEAAPLIVTALLEPDAASRFEVMRRAYFPPARNKTPAHLTLFHALPGAQLADIEDELAERCWQAEPFAARASGLRFLGAGVAILIEAPPLL